MAFQVIPGSFLDRMIKGWVQLLRKCLIFLAIDNTVLWKNCAKIQQLSRVSTFRLQIHAPNGTFSQPESTAGACCDARNCFDARTISDARGSNDAHTEWIKEVIACDVLPVALFMLHFISKKIDVAAPLNYLQISI